MPPRSPHHLRRAATAIRRNAIAWLALFIALSAGGGYALAASASHGTILVCVDKRTAVMHLAKHQRCGRRQTRVGLSSALDRPTVSAWGAANENGDIESGTGARIAHPGTGLYNITVTAPSCRHAFNNAPVVSVSDSEPPYSSGPTVFPVAWTETASTGVEAFAIHTGVVVNGAFQPRDEPFNFTDSCG